MDGPIALAAGGTGGHLFPALAVREGLVSRGREVHLVTDYRVDRIASSVPDDHLFVVASASLQGRNPLAIASGSASLIKGYLESRSLLKALKPDIVVGFGGYPTIPPVLAARMAGIPTLVHEANGVLGRANKLLVRFGVHLATGMELVAGADRARFQTHTGNPVREAVAKAALKPYPTPGADGPLNLLVFGGSQGAQFFSQILPQAVELMEGETRQRLRIVQQCRAEDLHEVRSAYDAMGVKAETAPFFSDLADRIAEAHLVVSRSGASTVSELAIVGRPAILVPYPYALDHDQAANAAALEAAEGAIVMPQSALGGEILARQLSDLFRDPEKLARMASHSRGVGSPDAVDKLANLIERLANDGTEQS